MPHINNALKRFQDCLLAVDKNHQPEKHHLYNGMIEMTRAMQELQIELRRLRQEINLKTNNGGL